MSLLTSLLAPGNGTTGYGRQVGRYYTRPGFALTSRTMGSGRLWFQPIRVSEAFSVDRLGVEVTTAAAGSTIRLGVYASDASGMPAALVVDGGTVDAGTTGAKEVVIAAALTSGIYWVVAAAAGGTPTVRAADATVEHVGHTDLLSAVQANTMGYYQDGVTGALPATATVADGVGNVPIIAYRVA